jgi:hypothetical protein
LQKNHFPPCQTNLLAAFLFSTGCCHLVLYMVIENTVDVSAQWNLMMWGRSTLHFTSAILSLTYAGMGEIPQAENVKEALWPLTIGFRSNGIKYTFSLII